MQTISNRAKSGNRVFRGPETAGHLPSSNQFIISHFAHKLRPFQELWFVAGLPLMATREPTPLIASPAADRGTYPLNLSN